MRKITNINKDWAFRLEADTLPETFPEDWEKLDLPYTWNGKDGQDGGNDYYRGKGYFAKKLTKEELTENDVCYIEFQGVNSSAEVFFNGNKIASHDGGYSAFRAELRGIKDENLLVVIADNRPNETVYPQVADFTFYGGIYRDVNLISVPAHHFDLDYYGGPGLTAAPEIKGSNAEVKVKAYAEGDIRFQILDGKKVIGEKTLTGKNPETYIEIKDVHLWNGRKDPFLYTLKATLVEDGKDIDSVSTRFGCRSYKIDPQKGFILNGKSYPLRGVSRHQDRPGIGNALLPEHHKEDIDLIMEVGATTVRLAHYQHSQVFYDLCDEKGLVVWAEIPYISRHMKTGTPNTKSQMTELIVQNFNHPSIVVWGLSNEITMNGADDKTLLENHKMLNDLVHRLDPTRLTTEAVISMCSIDNPYVHIPDVVSFNHYFGWYGGNTDMNGPWFDNFHKKYPNTPVGLSEYGCEALNWHTSSPEQGDYSEEYQAHYHEELIKQIDARPYLWATHVWNMFDFAADAREEGGECGMNHKGLVTFDRKYKKDSFYAYKAWLSDEPVLHICSKRYVDRVENKTKVTVYSNQKMVELFVNGESVGIQTKGKYPFFYFEVENKGESTITAKAGNLTDEAKIRKVDKFNEAYRMKEAGAIINWFELEAPEGYFSVNDTIGEILKSPRGTLFLGRMILKYKNTVMGDKSEDGEKGKGMSFSGFTINKSLIEMAKSFSVKRAFMLLGSKITKDIILDVNKGLNKIKKPRK